MGGTKKKIVEGPWEANAGIYFTKSEELRLSNMV